MASSPIDPSLRIGAVRLAVADLSRSVDFYERVLGLPLISRERDSALLGPDGTRPALELSAIERPTPLSPHTTGLFHVAWLHPSRGALADTVRRIVRERWPVEGASDHGVSEALYLGDPDGLGIEIYADRPREQWQRPPDGRGIRMVTLPLDLDDLLSHSALEDADPDGAATIAPDTSIGHVHLKVSDVARAVDFYRGVLGFEEQAMMPSAAFLSAGGYHHHIGLNSWQSRGAEPAPDSAPALREIDFELAGDDALSAVAQRAGAATAQPLALEDPDRVRLVFSPAGKPVAGATA
ncbi:MAG: catechol 2,3-dioxygenase [Solirubrobacteraceae bacterium]|jgi:catechol 2,3-dioxygenase|nr:catechol 2,3-dioxygenase [Solirubrobacteraceae bacterium]